ncbi:FAD-binding Berberine family protein [Forsythia ovata]|uniref:FAD-binding Berberine family protein n=1 Tax=Forsythia ovata TaxID=205694 RepID=A0ABD1S0C1_9LAMI
MQEKFPELGLVKEDCTEMPWIESVLFFCRFPRNTSLDVLTSRVPLVRSNFKGKSDYATEPIPEHGLKGIWKFLDEEAENRAELQFSPYGGRLNDYSESEIPFPHRG